MDDIMILMTAVAVDLQGFNETQFGIFDDEDRCALYEIWIEKSDKNVNRFIGYLSPTQKLQMALWATSRTSYDVKELITGLEKFTKHLQNVTYRKYPKTSSQPTPPEKKKKSLLKIHRQK